MVVALVPPLATGTLACTPRRPPLLVYNASSGQGRVGNTASRGAPVLAAPETVNVPSVPTL